MKIFALEMASPGNRQCASCSAHIFDTTLQIYMIYIGALSLYGAIMQRLANVDDREQKQFPVTSMTHTRIMTVYHSVDCAVWTR